MSIKIYAVIFGLIFLAVGILSYLPNFTTDGYLFNVLSINKYHGGFHIVTGILGLIAALNASLSRMYFKVFGVIYLFIAVLSLLVGGDLVYMRFNIADSLFHLIMGAIACYLGFGKPRRRDERTEEEE